MAPAAAAEPVQQAEVVPLMMTMQQEELPLMTKKSEEEAGISIEEEVEQEQAFCWHLD